MKNEIYQSQTGSQINLYSLIPNNEVKAIIHISHGMVEHA
jgi:alpha-beta hydrolase superfamily lysophospholipase